MNSSSIKRNLKEARKAIEDNDPEEALYWVEKVLEEDEINYIAYLFKAKAYQIQKDSDKALKSFEKATDIEPQNFTGWKGFFQVAKSQPDFEIFKKVLKQYLKLQLEEGVSTVDTINDVRNYLKSNNYDSDVNLQIRFLLSILPGSDLGNMIGDNFGKPDERLSKLINLINRDQKSRINSIIAKEKLKMPRVLNAENKKKLNALAWNVRSEYKLSQLYEMILNESSADALRDQYEEEYLRYLYELVQITPEKELYVSKVQNMVQDMVFLKKKSSFCWNLYFDWLDIRTITDIEENNIVFYLENFEDEGLASVLLAYLMSDVSPFSKVKFSKLKNKVFYSYNKGDDDDVNDDEVSSVDNSIENKEPSGVEEKGVSSEEVLSLMVAGIKKCEKSILANSIITEFYVYLHEYKLASDKCKEAIRLLAELQRNFGLHLRFSKERLLSILAVVYTYYEAPKNYPRAIELYDKILETTPNDQQALIGKGIISLEKEDFKTAVKFLEDAISIDNHNLEAKINLAWCNIRLCNYASGRNALLELLDETTNMNIRTRRQRSHINYCVAESYILENNLEGTNIKICYEHLIKSLQDYPNNSKSYTSLGYLYSKIFKDNTRSQKCFYKAFELDVGEIKAAKYLVDDFTSRNEWDMAEIICKRIVQTDRSRRILLNNTNDLDNSWPYRVLGCSSLNNQDDRKAIEWFQAALRMTSMNLECWIGLGEAYYNCGRLDAASKVFNRALALDPGSWISKYFLGTILCEMHRFQEGFQFLHQSLGEKKDEKCILMSLFVEKVNEAFELISNGFTGRALECITDSLTYILQFAETDMNSQTLWKTLGDCVRAFLIIKGKEKLFPLKKITNLIFNGMERLKTRGNLTEIESDQQNDLSASQLTEMYEKEEYNEVFSFLLINCFRNALNLDPRYSNRSIKSAAFYNLGLAYFEAYLLSDDIVLNDVSISYLRKAVSLESKNSCYWMLLGNAYAFKSPELSQHCYIKAISLENSDGEIWMNLASLYYKWGDLELSAQAYLRAQSVMPDTPKPWLGNALVLRKMGKLPESYDQFTHSYVVSNSRIPLVEFLYGYSVIEKRIKGYYSDSAGIEYAQEFSIANFAMENYSRFLPSDIRGLRVALVIAERCNDLKRGIQISNKLCGILEHNYEVNEDPAILEQYLSAKSSLARLQLGVKDYEGVITSAQIVLAATDDQSEGILASCSLSARVVIALAFFLNDQFDDSLEQLQIILSRYENSSELVCLTAKILNAQGTPDTKQAALDQLFTYIQSNDSSLIILLTLSAIAIVDDLQDYFVPFQEAFDSIPLQSLSSSARYQVSKILSEISIRMNKDNTDDIWKRSAFLFPSDYLVWGHLNTKMSLLISSLKDIHLNPSDLTNIYLSSGEFRQIQRALYLSPNNHEALMSLKGCI